MQLGDAKFRGIKEECHCGARREVWIERHAKQVNNIGAEADFRVRVGEVLGDQDQVASLITCTDSILWCCIG